MSSFSYVVDEHIGLMMRNNLPRFIRWYVHQIIRRLKTRPWAALRLFALLPVSILKGAIMITTLGKMMMQSGLLLC